MRLPSADFESAASACSAIPALLLDDTKPTAVVEAVAEDRCHFHQIAA